jgi:hypothetical protein
MFAKNVSQIHKRWKNIQGEFIMTRNLSAAINVTMFLIAINLSRIIAVTIMQIHHTNVMFVKNVSQMYPHW